jgi:glucose 1-dehydrogenase
MYPQLNNQVAIVTGASSGIGEAVAESLAASGAIVILNYPGRKSKEKTEIIRDGIKKLGGKAEIFMADVSDEKQVKQMFRWTIKKFGTVDILVNNAGIQMDSPFEKMSLKKWQRVLDVNLTGYFLCAREAVREFLRRGIQLERSVAAGKIIFISSVHQMIPWATHANYAASKGGIKLLMMTLAQEFAPQKIRVNSIAPGAIKTPINRAAWETPAALKKLLKLIPYKRIGKPSDIGKVALWLASDESDYINGTTIFVDGGMMLFPGFTTNG